MAATLPYHGGNLAWAAAQAGCSSTDILDFSASINPLGPPASAIAAIQDHLSQIQAYPDPHYSALRQVLADHHGLDPQWILPGNGAAELLTWAARDLAQAAVPCGVLDPGFRDYGRALQAFGVVPQLLPVAGLNPWQAPQSAGDPPGMPSQPLAMEKFAGSLLINTPHNPTGLLVNRGDLRDSLETGALVVVDEAFMDFIPEAEHQSCIPWLGEFPNLVVLRSLTKFYSLPGLRLGYALGHPDRLQRWQNWRDPWAVNSLAAAAGAAVIQDQDFQAQTFSWLRAARSQLFTGLQTLPGLCPHPSAANFFLVHSQQPVPALQRHLLLHHRILIRDCVSFPELGDRFFRVAVRTEPENQRLLTALATALATALGQP